MKTNQLMRLVQRLPEKPGILGRDEYSSFAVLLLLIAKEDEFHFVFQKRNQTIRQGGEISFPGGKFDASKDISLKDTALRETKEEMGIDRDKIRIIGMMDTMIAPQGMALEIFVGITEFRTDEMKINYSEVEKIFTFPVKIFEDNDPDEYSTQIEIKPYYIDKQTGKKIILFPSRELGLPERYHEPWGGFRHKIFVYKTSEGIIWGITARIIRDFVKKSKNI